MEKLIYLFAFIFWTILTLILVCSLVGLIMIMKDDVRDRTTWMIIEDAITKKLLI